MANYQVGTMWYHTDQDGKWIPGWQEQADAAGGAGPANIVSAPKITFPPTQPAPMLPDGSGGFGKPITSSWKFIYGDQEPNGNSGGEAYSPPPMQPSQASPPMFNGEAPKVGEFPSRLGSDSLLSTYRSLMAKTGGPMQNQNIGLQLMDDHQLGGKKTNTYLDDILTNVAKYGVDNYGKDF